MKYISILKRSVFLSVLVLAGCMGSSKTANVHILPTVYRINNVSSPLATPAVDEVVRLKPDKVHISACRTTPNAKIIQFNVELQARLKTEITGGFFENCPEI
ncbi:MAG: hypothetical protein ABWY08_17790 [Comamonas sp.]